MLTVLDAFAGILHAVAALLFIAIVYYCVFKFFLRRDLATFSENIRKASASLRKMFHKTKTMKKLQERINGLRDQVADIENQNLHLREKNHELERQLAKAQIGSLSLPSGEGGSLSYAEQKGALSEPETKPPSPEILRRGKRAS